jgi:hypothetical protein
MTQTNYIKARLVITSADVMPNIISEALQLTPEKTWLKGEPVHPKAINEHAENGWALGLVSPDSELVAERTIDKLIAIIPKDRLLKLHDTYKDRVSVELSLIIRLAPSGPTPSVSLSEAQVAFLAQCGASFDLDLYPA